MGPLRLGKDLRLTRPVEPAGVWLRPRRVALGAGVGAGAGAGAAMCSCCSTGKFAKFPWKFLVVCSKLVSKYVFRLPPQQPAVLNTCICSFSEPHFEYTEYVFDM